MSRATIISQRCIIDQALVRKTPEMCESVSSQAAVGQWHKDWGLSSVVLLCEMAYHLCPWGCCLVSGGSAVGKMLALEA